MKQRNAFELILWSSCLAMFAVGANSTAIMAALPSMTKPGGWRRFPSEGRTQWFFAEECFITMSEEANSTSVGQTTDASEINDLDPLSGAVIFGSVACANMDPIGHPTATDRVMSETPAT